MKNNNISTIKTNYKNHFNRKLWLTERRRDLEHYFTTRHIACGTLDDQPFWTVVPRTSLWKIPSADPTSVQSWYGIAGDHPTDIVLAADVNGDIREILSHFVNKWLQSAEKLKQGKDYGDFRIEHIEERPTIGKLIEDRARRLERIVNAENLWPENVLAFLPPAPSPDDELETD